MRVSSKFPESKVALVYPNNVLGHNYVDVFWELASKFGVKLLMLLVLIRQKKT